jgi:hypothetical protein
VATHYIKFDTTNPRPIELRVSPNSTSIPVYVLTGDLKVILLDEYVYPNCSFHYIQVDDTSNTFLNQNYYYVYSTHVKPLPNTPESAPVNCETNHVINTNYEPPDWTTRPVNVPYFNPRTLNFLVPISTEYLAVNSTNTQEFELYCKKKSIKLIFDYLGKKYVEEDIERYANYYIFSKLDDYVSGFRDRIRVKALMSFHIKYLDAIPLNDESLLQTAVEVIKIKTYQIERKLSYIADRDNNSCLFRYYHNQILGDMTTIGNNFSFKKEAKYIWSVHDGIKNLCKLNGADFSDFRNQDYYELVLDDCRNIIYATYFDADEKQCTPLMIGLSEFNKMVKKYNHNCIGYLQQIDNICLIDPCIVDYKEFIGTYNLYKPTITTEVNALSQWMDKFTKMTNDELYEYIQSILHKMNNAVKEYEEKKFNNYIKKLIKSKVIDPNKVDLRDPKVLGKLREKYESSEEADDIVYVDSDPIVEAFKNNIEYFSNTITSQFVGTNFLNPDNFFNEDENSILKYLKETEATAAGGPPGGRKGPRMLKKQLSRGKVTKSIYYQIARFYVYIMTKLSICNLTDKLLRCLAILLDMLGLSFSITTGTAYSFSYYDLKTKIIPYLSDEDKQTFYDIFITAFCVEKKDIVSIFISATGDRSYADTFAAYSYDQIKAELINKLIYKE